MPTRVYVYGDPGFLAGCVSSVDAFYLERDLNDFLQDRGRVLYGDEHSGIGWHVEVELEDRVDVEAWIPQLATFLRRWSVPEGPVYLSISGERDGIPIPHRHITI